MDTIARSCCMSMNRSNQNINSPRTHPNESSSSNQVIKNGPDPKNEPAMISGYPIVKVKEEKDLRVSEEELAELLDLDKACSVSLGNLTELSSLYTHWDTHEDRHKPKKTKRAKSEAKATPQPKKITKRRRTQSKSHVRKSNKKVK